MPDPWDMFNRKKSSHGKDVVSEGSANTLCSYLGAGYWSGTQTKSQAVSAT